MNNTASAILRLTMKKGTQLACIDRSQINTYPCVNPYWSKYKPNSMRLVLEHFWPPPTTSTACDRSWAKSQPNSIQVNKEEKPGNGGDSVDYSEEEDALPIEQ